MDEKIEKKRVLIARKIDDDLIYKLRQSFEVIDNQQDIIHSQDELISLAKDSHAIMVTDNETINEKFIKNCPNLKIVANMAVGYNNLDVLALTKANIIATNTPNVLTETVADFAFALLMSVARRVNESDRFLRAGEWERWTYDLLVGSEINNTTLGILGMGRIGQAIAKRASFGFNMKVLYHNRSRLNENIEKECKANYVYKEELLKQSDHIILIMPLNNDSRYIISLNELKLMKPTVNLINVGRGGLINESDLIYALENNIINAVGLDVFENEPNVNQELLKFKNLIATPHLGSSTFKTRLAMATLAVNNIMEVLTGNKPITPVN